MQRSVKEVKGLPVHKFRVTAAAVPQAALAALTRRPENGAMRLKKKSGYHHGDLRRALLDVSIAVIDKHGVDALNLRELAIRAGVSSGAPYHHFAQRQALFAAIAEEGFGYLEEAMVRERDAAPDDATSRLAALGRAYVSFATAHRGHFRVMFRGDLIGELVQAKPRAFQLLWEAIEDCQRSGVAPAGDLFTGSQRSGSTERCRTRT
jgi:AcrR family transcriptional regulator